MKMSVVLFTLFFVGSSSVYADGFDLQISTRSVTGKAILKYIKKDQEAKNLRPNSSIQVTGYSVSGKILKTLYVQFEMKNNEITLFCEESLVRNASNDQWIVESGGCEV